MSFTPKPVVPPTSVVIAVLVAVALVALGLWAYQVNHDMLIAGLNQGAAAMRRLPWPVFYLAIALLPFVFFPVSLLYLSAGAVHGLWASLAGIALATAVNISLGYWLASGPLRVFLQGWFVRRGRTVPVLPADEQIWAVLVVRFTPALPLMLQNYLLGLARVPFRTYFFVSLGAEIVIAFCYILAGEALTQNHPWYVLAAFASILAALAVTRLLRWVFAKKLQPLP